MSLPRHSKVSPQLVRKIRRYRTLSPTHVRATLIKVISSSPNTSFVSTSEWSSNRSFHGRGGHLGSGANAAKFTVNVWGKS